MTRSISFIFGSYASERPSGGAKVVLEYANRLAADGWNVYLVVNVVGLHYRMLGKIGWTILNTIKYYCKKKKNNFAAFSNWFSVNKNVNVVYVPKITYKNVPESDLYVATSVGTASFTNDYPVSLKRKFYFIQGYETWGTWNEAKVRLTYHYELNKFVISHWLQNILEEEHVESVMVLNGFDFNNFKMKTIPEKKNRYSISMLYHRDYRKGCEISLKALIMVKRKISQLEVKMFGVFDKPSNLPTWVTYYKQPNKDTHNYIYDASAIFIGSSYVEGWGLTIGESMMCGAAVACSDCLGYKEMVTDHETGLLSPVKDYSALANNILNLIENDELRIRLAYNAHRNIQNFTWDKSYAIMSRELLKGLGEN